MIDSLVFVVSLPRTGTSSLTDYLMQHGLKGRHPLSIYENDSIEDGYNLFSDTPCFDPAYLCYVKDKYKNSKFIYIERNPVSWVNSFQEHLATFYPLMVNDNSNNPVNQLDKITYGNVFGYDGVFSREKFIIKFYEHYKNINSVLKSEKLLIFNPDNNLDDLHNFLNIQKRGILYPHLNKNTIFEKDFN